MTIARAEFSLLVVLTGLLGPTMVGVTPTAQAGSKVSMEEGGKTLQLKLFPCEVPSKLRFRKVVKAL